MTIEKNGGTRARQAVELLCQALWDHRVVEASPQEWYRAGIRMALRVVAIRFAEARRLLPLWSPVYEASYSLGGLWRQLELGARSSKGELAIRHSAWPRLQALFRLVHGGSPHPRLTIRAYGGELLEPGDRDAGGAISRALWCFEQAGHSISDAVTHDFLSGLLMAARGRPVPFSRLSADYVGVLYQAFLEGEPGVTPQGGFTLGLSRRGRKSSGAFYTPGSLASAIAEKTLAPVCHAGAELRPPEALLQLRVLDPAMGSGAFLVAALRYLSQVVVASIRRHGRLEPLGGKTIVRWGPGREVELPLDATDETFEDYLLVHVRRHVVECCLYGVDLDPTSVELARFSLWLETMDRRLPFTFLSHKLKVGDSLVGASLTDLAIYPLAAWRSWPGEGQEHLRSQAEVQLARIASAARNPPLPLADGGGSATTIRARLARKLERVHRMPVQLADEKRLAYQRQVLESSELTTLKRALDSWCSLWFWPAEAPLEGTLPEDWYGGPALPTTRVLDIATRHAFFHWELEFPEVFARRRPGFDILLGNPPWEVLRSQGEQGDTRHRQLANFLALRHRPAMKFQRALGASLGHLPYQFQGQGDTNTYKLFLEQSFHLLRTDGRLGFVVPAGIHADAGTGELRRLLVTRGRWEWLYGMDNRRRVFPIDSRFRFAAIVVQKGGRTKQIAASFLNSSVEGWTHPASTRWEDLAVPAPPSRGPAPPLCDATSRSARQALSVLVMAPGRALARGRSNYRCRYRREVSAGGAGKIFHERPHWPDADMNALGLLCNGPGPGVALPVFQGAMIQPYSFLGASWDPHARRWSPGADWSVPGPVARFYMAPELARTRVVPEFKVAVRRITNATNTRTIIATLVPPLPCSDKAAVLDTENPVTLLLLLASLNSVCADTIARVRCVSTQFDRHHLEGLELPRPEDLAMRELATLVLRLAAPHPWFAPLWLSLRHSLSLAPATWGGHFIHAPEMRRHAMAAIDALVAQGYGLSQDDLAGLLSDCGHPAKLLEQRDFVATLDPRGFWRVDRHLPPEERQTGLALTYHRLLLNRGPAALLDALGMDLSAPAELSWRNCETAAESVDQVRRSLAPEPGPGTRLL